MRVGALFYSCCCRCRCSCPVHVCVWVCVAGLEKKRLRQEASRSFSARGAPARSARHLSLAALAAPAAAEVNIFMAFRDEKTLITSFEEIVLFDGKPWQVGCTCSLKEGHAFKLVRMVCTINSVVYHIAILLPGKRLRWSGVTWVGRARVQCFFAYLAAARSPGSKSVNS